MKSRGEEGGRETGRGTEEAGGRGSKGDERVHPEGGRGAEETVGRGKEEEGAEEE